MDEKELITGTVAQAATAPVHVAADTAQAVVEGMLRTDPGHTPFDVPIDAALAAEKAVMREAVAASERAARYAASLPFRALGLGVQMAMNAMNAPQMEGPEPILPEP